MKKLLIVLISFQLYSQVVVDKVVAVVEKEIITESDLIFNMQMLAAQNNIDLKTEGLREKVLDRLISEKLILAQAEEDSIIVSDEEVADRLDRQIKMLVQNFGSEERLEQAYKMPIGKMKREFKDEVKKQLITQKIKQTQEMSLTVSRREVEEFFLSFKDSLPNVPTEYELNHIYIKPKPDSLMELEALKKAQSIIDSIKLGKESFESFAKKYSNDPGSASLGGDLGSVKRGVFVKEFEEAAYTLHPKEISKPIKTIFGFHIIELIERKGDAVHPRHILIKIKESATSDEIVINKLNGIREKVKNGESFALLAKTNSDDNETKDIGGDMGRLIEDQVDEKVFSVIKNLKTGDVSEPQKIYTGAQYGYQIVYIRSITPAHVMNMNDDYKKLENFAMQFKSNKKYTEWIDGLKKTIYWEIKN